MSKVSLEEMKSNPSKFFIQLKEISRHPEGFEGWSRDESARIEKSRAARGAWVAAEAARIAG